MLLIWSLLYSFTDLSTFTFTRFVSPWGVKWCIGEINQKSVGSGGTSRQRSCYSDMLQLEQEPLQKCSHSATGQHRPKIDGRSRGAREGIKVELMEPVLLWETSTLPWLRPWPANWPPRSEGSFQQVPWSWERSFIVFTDEVSGARLLGSEFQSITYYLHDICKYF